MYPYPNPILINSCWCPVRAIGIAGATKKTNPNTNSFNDIIELNKLFFILLNCTVKKIENTVNIKRAQQDIEKLILDTEKLEDKVRANGSH